MTTKTSLVGLDDQPRRVFDLRGWFLFIIGTTSPLWLFTIEVVAEKIFQATDAITNRVAYLIWITAFVVAIGGVLLSRTSLRHRVLLCCIAPIVFGLSYLTVCILFLFLIGPINPG